MHQEKNDKHRRQAKKKKANIDIGRKLKNFLNDNQKIFPEIKEDLNLHIYNTGLSTLRHILVKQWKYKEKRKKKENLSGFRQKHNVTFKEKKISLASIATLKARTPGNSIFKILKER